MRRVRTANDKPDPTTSSVLEFSGVEATWINTRQRAILVRGPNNTQWYIRPKLPPLTPQPSQTTVADSPSPQALPTIPEGEFDEPDAEYDGPDGTAPLGGSPESTNTQVVADSTPIAGTPDIPSTQVVADSDSDYNSEPEGEDDDGDDDYRGELTDEDDEEDDEEEDCEVEAEDIVMKPKPRAKGKQKAKGKEKVKGKGKARGKGKEKAEEVIMTDDTIKTMPRNRNKAARKDQADRGGGDAGDRKDNTGRVSDSFTIIGEDALRGNGVAEDRIPSIIDSQAAYIEMQAERAKYSRKGPMDWILHKEPVLIRIFGPYVAQGSEVNDVKAIGSYGQVVTWAAVTREVSSDYTRKLQCLQQWVANRPLMNWLDFVNSMDPVLDYVPLAGRAQGTARERSADRFFEPSHWAYSFTGPFKAEIYAILLEEFTLRGKIPSIEFIISQYSPTISALEQLATLARESGDYDCHGDLDKLRNTFFRERRSTGGNSIHLKKEVIKRAHAEFTQEIDSHSIPCLSSLRTLKRTMTRPPTAQGICDYASLSIALRQARDSTAGRQYAMKKVPKNVDVGSLGIKWSGIHNMGSTDTLVAMSSLDKKIVNAVSPFINTLVTDTNLRHILAQPLQLVTDDHSVSTTTPMWIKKLLTGIADTVSDDEKAEKERTTALIIERVKEAVTTFEERTKNEKEYEEGLRSTFEEKSYNLEELLEAVISEMKEELTTLATDSMLSSIVQLIVDACKSPFRDEVHETYPNPARAVPTKRDKWSRFPEERGFGLLEDNLRRVYQVLDAHSPFENVKDEVMEVSIVLVVWALRGSTPVLPLLFMHSYMDTLWVDRLGWDNAAHVPLFKTIQNDLSYGLVECAFSTEETVRHRRLVWNGTKFEVPNIHYIDLISSQQHGISGSLDSDEALYWHPLQRRATYGRDKYHIAIGSYSARTVGTALNAHQHIPTFPSGRCPWVWLPYTFSQACGIAWCCVGYAYLFDERKLRGKPQNAFMANCMAAMHHIEEHEEEYGEYEEEEDFDMHVDGQRVDGQDDCEDVDMT